MSGIFSARCPPVVHQEVRLPDVLGRDPDVGDISVLGLVPD